MAVGASISEEEWSAKPATKGDLALVKADLVSVKADLDGKIKDLRVEMINMGRDLSRDINEQGRRLGAEIQELREGIAQLGVSMARMTAGVAAGLGTLITVFQFLA